MFGGNDDHGFMTGLPEGSEVGSFGSPSWRRRVPAARRRDHGHGHERAAGSSSGSACPSRATPDQTQRYDVINAIVQTEAAKRKGRVSYLDTYFFFAGEDGGYAQYVEDATGKLVKMRADDGVHFERAAGDLIADKVLERLSERYDFTSWRGGS